MAKRSSFKFSGREIPGRSYLVGFQFHQQFFVSPKHSLVGTKEFIGGTNQEITTQFLDIGDSMGHILNGIDVNQSSFGFHLLSDGFDVIDRPQAVTGIIDCGQQYIFRFQEIFEHLQLVFVSFQVKFEPTNFQPQIFRQLQPWGDITVMIHPCQQQGSAFLKTFSQRTRYGISQCGHVGAEDDFRRTSGIQ